MGSGSARTLKHWIDLGYTTIEAERLRLSRTPGTIEYFTIYKGMSESDAIVAKTIFQAKRANTLENMITKYGVIDGEIHWQIYKDKQAYSNTFEYKRYKHGWDYEKWNSFNKSRGSVGTTNPMYGTSYYARWVELYGTTEANRMNDEVGILKARHGSDNGNYNRKKTDIELERMQQSAIKRVIRQGTVTAYNKGAIPIIDQYGKENGYKFQHAENGGEYQIPGTRFFVDAYDLDKNVVLEYDERHHFRGKQIIDDIKRQEIIGNKLKCTFIRLDYKGNVIITQYEN